MQQNTTRRPGAAHAADRGRGQITAADLIARARRKQADRAGVRVMVRLPTDMLARATACAKEIDEPVGDWVNKACRQHRAGVFDGVAFDDKKQLATREASTPTHVRAPRGMSAEQIKEAVARAVAFCESRRIEYRLEVPPRYILENKDR